MIRRDNHLNHLIRKQNNGLVKVITGIRRCGKSVVMKQIMNEIKQSGIDAEHIIYLDL